MENQQQQIQPEVLSSIALLNVGGQPYIEYNVNGMRDAFPINWEQVEQMQKNWRGDLFFLRGERQKAQAERQEAEAEKPQEKDGETSEVLTDQPAGESPSEVEEDPKEEGSE